MNVHMKYLKIQYEVHLRSEIRLVSTWGTFMFQHSHRTPSDSGSSTIFAPIECVDKETIMIMYDNEDCSGTSSMSASVYDGPCSNITIGSCTTGGEGCCLRCWLLVL